MSSRPAIGSETLGHITVMIGYGRPRLGLPDGYTYGGSTGTLLKAMRRFADDIVGAIRDCKILGLRAGSESHCFIGIWAVVVGGRVFVRSWSLKPRSWYRTFLKEPRGIIQVADRQILVRAVRTRSERLKDAVDRAYLQKYSTRGSIKCARDLGRPKSRATTTELVPISKLA